MRVRPESSSELRVIALDCDLLMADGACFPIPNIKKHKLLITGAPPGALLVTLHGQTTEQAEALIVDSNQSDYHLFLVPLPRKNAVYTVSAKGDKGTRTTLLQTFEPELPDWLRDLWNARYPNKKQGDQQEVKKEDTTVDRCTAVRRELATLAQHASDPTLRSGVARSLYLSLTARNLYARCIDGDTTARPGVHNQEIIQTFRDAIQAAESARVISERNENVLWLSEFLSKQAGRLDDAEKLLDAYKTPLQTDPRKISYYYRQIALHQGLRHQLNDALQSLVQALIWAQRIDDQNAALDVVMQAADFLLEHGRVATAVKWVTQRWRSRGIQADAYQALDGEGCRQEELIRTKLRIIRVAREMAPLRSLPLGIESPEDLHTAFFAKQRNCEQELWRTEFLMDWARLQLILGKREEVRQSLRMLFAEKHELHKESWVVAERRYLEGMLALQEGRVAEATSHFLALRESSTSIADVSNWQALVGLGQVAEAQHTPDGDAVALSYYQSAETWVDLNSLSVPLGLGRGSFLGQFEQGTRLHLAQLWKMGDLAGAFALIRRVRVRGLRGLPLLQHTHHGNQQRKALAAKLLELRTKVEQRTAEYRGAAGNQKPLRESEIVGSYIEHARELSDYLASVAAGDAWLFAPLGEPLSHEVMITCHPLPTGWLCLAKDASGVAATQLADADLDPIVDADPIHSPTAQRLSQKLLEPFSDKIAAAQLVSFLTYGKMRRIDLQMLPFGLQRSPLQRHREVVFASDVPSHRESYRPHRSEFLVNMNQKSYLYFNHEMKPVVSTIPVIKRAVHRLGHDYRANDLGPWLRPWLRPRLLSSGEWAADTATQQFASETANADLLHVITHANDPAEGAPERYLDLEHPRRFYVSDILMLERVPKWVTLFGCGTARSEEEWTNVEGVGLAQAFLWRGSHWVLGTERTVGTELGARVSASFYEELAKTGDPFQSLRYALEHSGVSMANARQVPDQDLGAFRLYAQ